MALFMVIKVYSNVKFCRIIILLYDIFTGNSETLFKQVVKWVVVFI